MHEHGLMNDLMRRIARAAEADGGERVVAVSVWLGALSHMTPEHFREHFEDVLGGNARRGREIGHRDLRRHPRSRRDRRSPERRRGGDRRGMTAAPNGLAPSLPRIRSRIEVRGLVQGVGFRNADLAEKAIEELRAAGMTPYWHERAPPNDGGLVARPGGLGGADDRTRSGVMCLAIPGQVLTIAGDDPLMRTARVDFGGIVKEINLAFTPEARPDDYVLVHVGFAITVIDEAEAERVFEHLATIGEIEAELATERRSAVMKFREEYRDAAATGASPRRSRAPSPGRGRSWRCAAARRTRSSATASTSLLPPEITLIHGPGCPVCVTPVDYVDKAIAIAETAGRDPLLVRRHAARAGQRRRSACRQSRAAPTCASSIRRSTRCRSRAERRIARSCSSPSASRRRRRPTRWPSIRRSSRAYGISRCSPRMCWFPRRCARSSARRTTACRASSPPGHVCTIMGFEEYEPIAARYKTPIVVTGFEPLDIVEGVYLLRQTARRGPCRSREPVQPLGEARGQYRRRRRSCARSTRSSGGAGAASARSRRADWRSRTPIAPSTPRRASVAVGAREEAFERMHRRPRAVRRQEALRLPGLRRRAARPSVRSASPWCPPKAPAPPITAIAARRRRRSRAADGRRRLRPLLPGSRARRRIRPARPRRRRAHDRAPARHRLPAGLRRSAARDAGTTARVSTSPGRSPSPPIPMWCVRWSFPAATSARWRSTARSTISRCAARGRSHLSAGFILEEGLEHRAADRHRRLDARRRACSGRRASSPAISRWSIAARRTGCSSTPAASAPSSRHAESSRRACGPATRSSSPATSAGTASR